MQKIDIYLPYELKKNVEEIAIKRPDLLEKIINEGFREFFSSKKEAEIDLLLRDINACPVSADRKP